MKPSSGTNHKPAFPETRHRAGAIATRTRNRLNVPGGFVDDRGLREFPENPNQLVFWANMNRFRVTASFDTFHFLYPVPGHGGGWLFPDRDLETSRFPAPVHQDPLFRVVPDGRFEEARAQRGLPQDGLFLREVREGLDRRKKTGRMMDPVLPPKGKHGNDGDAESIGESGQARVSECQTVEEGDENAVILPRALVDCNVDNLSAAQSAENLLGSVGGKNGGPSTESQSLIEDELVDRRGLDLSDEGVHGDWRVDPDPAHDQFPVPYVAGKNDRSLAGFELCGDVFESSPPVFEQLPYLVVGKDGQPGKLDTNPTEVSKNGPGEGTGTFPGRKRESASGKIVFYQAPLRRAYGQEDVSRPVSDPEGRSDRKKT